MSGALVVWSIEVGRGQTHLAKVEPWNVGGDARQEAVHGSSQHGEGWFIMLLHFLN